MSLQKVNQTTGATTPIAGVPAATINGIRDNINKNGAKNLLPANLELYKALNTSGTWSSNEYTKDGLTYTINSDYSIKITGTASANTSLVLQHGSFAAGNYICSKGYDQNMPVVAVNSVAKATNIAEVRTTEVSFTIDSADSAETWVSVYTTSGTAYGTSGITIYPMYRLASDKDNTYVPYAMTNKELTDASVTVVALNSTYVNTGTIWYVKRGKQVIVNVDNLSVTSSATQSTALNSTKLPKPIANVNYKTRACGWTAKSNNGGVALLEISSAGDFTLGGYLPTALTESCYGQLTYFTNE